MPLVHVLHFDCLGTNLVDGLLRFDEFLLVLEYLLVLALQLVILLLDVI